LGQLRRPRNRLHARISSEFVESAKREESSSVPTEGIALTEEWIDSETSGWETHRALPPHKEPPLIACEAARLRMELQEVRARDSEVLEPALVRALDECAAEIDWAISSTRSSIQNLKPRRVRLLRS
jgi:hypothetical protein